MISIAEPVLTSDRMILKLNDMEVSDEAFIKICQDNPDFQLERYGKTQLIVMPPTFSNTGKINMYVSGNLFLWNEASQLGEVFDSSTGFKMPDESILSPDVAWVGRSRWQSLTKTQQEDEFAPICPDLVVEIRSKSDRLAKLKTKMENWLHYGCQEAWLIDIAEQKVYIYRSNEEEAQMIPDFSTKISSVLLPDFALDLSKIL
ncbi:MAG: Uma2 family endonuclease [Microscillaceae bacterium]|jgi:Uma2 family endonuclease|nr:Uma2 family endonuclease [Microscillaceae bacterium]